MTEIMAAAPNAVPSGPGGSSPPLRIAVLDRDSGFVRVLGKRLDELGCEYRVLDGPHPAEAIVSMRLSALVVNLALMGPQAWQWLECLCDAAPELGVIVCTGPSSVAQRVRGLRLGAVVWLNMPAQPYERIAHSVCYVHLPLHLC